MIIAYMGIALIAIMAFRGGQRGRIDDRHLAINSAGCLVFSFLALIFFLNVVAPRVPYQVKDGLFGGAGGLIFGSCFISISLAATILGRCWKNFKEPSIKNSEVKAEKNSWENLPPWLNRMSHSCNGICIGVLLANLLMNWSHGTYLLKPSGTMVGGLYGATIVYAITMLIYLAKTKLENNSNEEQH